MRKENRDKGFTLIEMIAGLVIVGILAAMAGLGIVSVVQGYMFSKDNAAVSEKAQLAMARINRELLECYDCSTAITLPYIYNNTLGPRTIQWSGANNPIEIKEGTNPADILLDNVADFSMVYNNTDKYITVTIRSSIQPGGVTVPDFVTTVFPRNTP
jgi:prepilin-type N-terminal cleavage/methylation domain-containing protein